jgi:hypothetical protein
MRKIILFLLCAVSFVNFSWAQATFSNADTVSSWAGNAVQYNAYITNLTGNMLAVNWKVTATDFPSDWVSSLSMCDNHICYTNGTGVMWNGTSGTQFHSGDYGPHGTGDFHLVNNFSGTITGTHYVTVTIADSGSSFSKTTTFIIKHAATGVTTVVKSDDDVIIYPNPAVNDVNIIFSENAGIKTIAIYNIIGKAINVYKVSGNSANLGIDNLPAGVYFLRLLNGDGNLVATRKFNKQ